MRVIVAVLAAVVAVLGLRVRALKARQTTRDAIAGS